MGVSTNLRKLLVQEFLFFLQYTKEPEVVHLNDLSFGDASVVNIFSPALQKSRFSILLESEEQTNFFKQIWKPNFKVQEIKLREMKCLVPCLEIMKPRAIFIDFDEDLCPNEGTIYYVEELRASDKILISVLATVKPRNKISIDLNENSFTAE